MYYLDANILIDFHRPAKNENPLRKICKFPHISELINHTWFFWKLTGFHLLPSTLPGGDHLEVKFQRSRYKVYKPLMVG